MSYVNSSKLAKVAPARQVSTSPPAQDQLLLQLVGVPDEVDTTVSYAAERLGLRHHTVVELSKRCCEEAGLIHRNQDLERAGTDGVITLAALTV